MKNKKAWLRIAEAFIAVLLIAGVLVYFYTKTSDTSNKAEDIINFENGVLEQIANDNSLRNQVLINNLTYIKEFAGTRIPAGFNYDIRICAIEDICGLQHYEAEMFSSERIISSSLQIYSPKKIKIFMWQEE